MLLSRRWWRVKKCFSCLISWLPWYRLIHQYWNISRLKSHALPSSHLCHMITSKISAGLFAEICQRWFFWNFNLFSCLEVLPNWLTVDMLSWTPNLKPIFTADHLELDVACRIIHLLQGVAAWVVKCFHIISIVRRIFDEMTQNSLTLWDCFQCFSGRHVAVTICQYLAV